MIITGVIASETSPAEQLADNFARYPIIYGKLLRQYAYAQERDYSLDAARNWSTAVGRDTVLEITRKYIIEAVDR